MSPARDVRVHVFSQVRHGPTFHVADVAISVGIALFMASQLRARRVTTGP